MLRKNNECLDDKTLTKKICGKFKKIINEFDEQYKYDLQKIKLQIDKDYIENLNNIKKLFL